MTEEASYKVLLKEGDQELRNYDRQIVAETIVEGDFDEVGNIAFRRLFKYISGENISKDLIPMTAPVSQRKNGINIPMTAPVNQKRDGNSWSITFLMPSDFNLQTIPRPVDELIKIREVPERTMAAITYSGSWSQSRYNNYKARLLEWMRSKNITQSGEPVYARYNPPFTLWFLRRNEVLIPFTYE